MMKVAVLCFVHKDASLLNVLIEQLLSLSEEVTVFIHLDKKSERIKKGITSMPNVKFIKNVVSVTWGDDSMMRAMFNSLNEIYACGVKYDYFFICTGQDLMIKKGLREFLESNKDSIFLDAKKGRHNTYNKILTHRFPRKICRDLSKFKWYHPLRLWMSLYFRLMSYGLAPKKKNIERAQEIEFFYSFNWSVMPYEVMEYVVEFLSKNAWFKNLYYNTYIPEDGFLATVIMNSPYRDKVKWTEEEDSITLTYHTPIKIHPKVFTIDDIDEIESSNCFFARKFDSKVDRNVIDYFRNKVLE